MFEGGALCLGPTIRENILWSAYAWRQIVYNWRAKLIAPLCRRISFGWRGNGPAWRIKDRTRILRPSADTRTKNRIRELPSRRGPSRRQAPALRYKVIAARDVRASDNLFLEGMGPAGACDCSMSARPVDMSLAVLGFLTSCVALLYRPEPRLRAASGRHRTAPLRRRSIRMMPFRGRRGRELEFSPRR